MMSYRRNVDHRHDSGELKELMACKQSRAQNSGKLKAAQLYRSASCWNIYTQPAYTSSTKVREVIILCTPLHLGKGGT